MLFNQTLAVFSANLFQVASQQYNDATMWYLIAAASGLIDPVVQSTNGQPITLTIPPINKSYSGGIPPTSP
jgi:hypothetical protein